MHTVIVSREVRKDKKTGEPVIQRMSLPIGKPFDFTDEEHDDIMAMSPGALRDVVNEGAEDHLVVENDRVEQAAREAAEQARTTGAAPGDAAVTAKTAATGRSARKQPDNNNAGEAADDEEL